MNERKDEIKLNPNTKFEIVVEYTVTETYEITTKTIGVAQGIAERGTMAPVKREVRSKHVVSAKEAGPRYRISTASVWGRHYSVIDMDIERKVGEANERTHAQMLCDALNAKEEEK